MGKLHESIAVQKDLQAAAQNVVKSVKHLFESGHERLLGKMRSYQPVDEDGQQFADEITELATTVEGQLAAMWGAYGPWLDAAFQKETTNQHARADIVINDVLIAKDVPVTALLNLEGKLAELKGVYARIPTNDPTEQWTWDKQQGQWMSQERVTYRGQKVLRAFVKYEATPEHPAQVESYGEDVRVGAWTTVIRSGMLSPTEKGELLMRIDTLLRAVKQARQRANCEEVKKVCIADILLDYIVGAA